MYTVLVSVAVALVGIGIGILVRLMDVTPRTKRVWTWIGVSFILTGVAILGVFILQSFGVGLRSPIFIAGDQGTPFPRRLTQEQKDSLVKRLRGKSGGRVVTIRTLEDPETEPRQYAEDFIEVFTAAEWEVKRDLYPGLNAAPVLMFFQRNDHAATVLLGHLEGMNIQVRSSRGEYSSGITFVIGPRQPKG